MFGNILSALFLTLIGAALLFNGYRWFRILLPIWAFLVGYGIIAGLMSAAFGHGFFSTALTIVPGIVVGLLFAVLSYAWYTIAVLFWSGTVGYVVFAGLLSALGITNWFLVWIVGLVGALIFVGIATRAELRRYLPIFLTAVAGATLILSAWLMLWGRPLEELNWGSIYGPLSGDANGSWLAIMLWLLLMFIGLATQSGTNHRHLEVDLARYDERRFRQALV